MLAPVADPFGTAKPDKKEYKDALAAGRKYALRKYAPEPGQICDWAWSINCGGGVVPITGCTGREAKHVHHGPDKSTINNDRATNISVICTHCHNLWHSKNNEYYPGDRPMDGSAWVPTKAYHPLSEREVAENKLQVVEFELGIGREVDPELIKQIMLDKQI